MIERTAKTGVDDQPEIYLVLRLPKKSDKPISGVLAFCNWTDNPSVLRGKIADDANPLVKYAMERNLAMLTWSTATLWKTGRSYNQISRDELREQDSNFDSVARAWNQEVNKFCKEFKLPEDGFLLYGVSRGAHWSGRLALRSPKRFLAVHIHVANSYDKPTRAAIGPLWLVSSGDQDPGRFNIRTFYDRCRSIGYPIILKVPNGLGHSENGEIIKLRKVFFDYALDVKKRAEKDGVTPASLMIKDMAESGLIGDSFTQEVLRDPSKIPEAQRMPLPNETVARAWGFMSH